MGTAAALAALAVLAHGGVATSLVGFGLVLSLPRLFPGWRNALLGVLVMGALIAPWTAYQRYADPPGNYVIKNHLAGIKQRDDRGTLEAVLDAYSALSLRELAEMKWRKLRFVLGLARVPIRIDDFNHFLSAMRHYQFRHVFLSLDVLNAGWLVVLGGALFGPARVSALSRRLAYVLGIAIVCLIAWILLLLSAPFVQHGSYATMILLFAGLAAAIAQLPPRISLPLLSLHVVLSPAAILGFSLERQYALSSLMAAAASYLALIAFSVSTFRRMGGHPHPPPAVESG
jgi:MFS family permease